jgi:hypothetical protein
MAETLTKPLPDVATAWLRGLAARGVTVTIRNGRLCLHPAAAHKSFTDAEVLTLRHHRGEIKAAVAAGIPLDVACAVPTETPRITTPEPCAYCGRACVGRDHHAFDTLHALDPIEQQRRHDEEREHDTREWEMRRAYGIPTPRWP